MMIFYIIQSPKYSSRFHLKVSKDIYCNIYDEDIKIKGKEFAIEMCLNYDIKTDFSIMTTFNFSSREKTFTQISLSSSGGEYDQSFVKISNFSETLLRVWFTFDDYCNR